MSYYEKLYNKVGKRIGWDFSQVKKVEVGKTWDFFQEVLKTTTQNDVLLDIGTGGGEKVLKVASKVKFVYGIDYSDSMIATAMKNLKRSRSKNVKFILMNASKLEFPSNYFNVVTDRHCSFNPTEVYRVLKKGGYFLTQQVSEGDQLNVKKAFKRGQAYRVKDGTLKNGYLKQLKEIGFKNIKSFEYNSTVYYKTAKDYLFVLQFTPTIPEFGSVKNDLKVFRNFVEKNKTDKGIKTNAERFMITALK